MIHFDQVYLEYWIEIGIKSQIKFHHIISFRIIPEVADVVFRKNKGVLKNFANLTGKNLYRNLFLKVAGLEVVF